MVLVIALRIMICIYLTIAIQSIKETMHQKCDNIFDKVSATIHLVSFYIFCLSNVPILISVFIDKDDTQGAFYLWSYWTD